MAWEGFPEAPAQVHRVTVAEFLAERWEDLARRSDTDADEVESMLLRIEGIVHVEDWIQANTETLGAFAEVLGRGYAERFGTDDYPARLARCEALARFPNLALDLTLMGADAAQMLLSSPALAPTHLRLAAHERGPGSGAFAKLASAPFQRTLEHLELEACDDQDEAISGDGILRGLAEGNFDRLKTLILHRVPASASALAHFLNRSTSLRRIRISESALGDTGLAELSDCAGLSRLEELSLPFSLGYDGEGDFAEAGPGFRRLVSSPYLAPQSLDLNGCPGALQILATAPLLDAVSALTVSATTQSLAQLAKRPLPRLRTLTLWSEYSPSWTPLSLAPLRDAPFLAALETLVLDPEAKNVRAMVESKALDHLRSLYMPIEPDALRAVLQSPNLPSLHTLSLPIDFAMSWQDGPEVDYASLCQMLMASPLPTLERLVFEGSLPHEIRTKLETRYHVREVFCGAAEGGDRHQPG